MKQKYYGTITKVSSGVTAYRDCPALSLTISSAGTYVFDNCAGTVTVTNASAVLKITNGASLMVNNSADAATYRDGVGLGGIIQSVEEISPSAVFGGNWEQITDRFILAAGSTNAAGSTGGSNEHTHNQGTLFADIGTSGTAAITANVVSKIPNTYKNIKFSAAISDYSSTNSDGVTVTGTTGSASNLPPYIAAYTWKRTAINNQE